MRIIISIKIVFFCLFFSAPSLFGQENKQAYLIQVASYADPQYKDFLKIEALGYLYAHAQPNGLFKVFMGTYANFNTAQRILSKIKAKGYQDAFISPIEVDNQEAVYMVQLATLDQKEDIYWAAWSRLSNNICIQLSETQLRVAVGPFSTEAEAEQERLSLIQKTASKEIFVRAVSPAVLHPLSNFEMQRNLKHDHSRSERTSIKSLQIMLQAMGYYQGKIDGIIGAQTTGALEMYKEKDEAYQKYLLLTTNKIQNPRVDNFTLQYYINLIDHDPYQAEKGLKSFVHPAAKAYLAYMYLNGDIEIADKSRVNDLMNQALQETFRDYRLPTRYDFSLRYDYKNLEQLVMHLRALLEAVKDEPDVPCWLFRRHPKLVLEVFAPYWNNERDDYQVSYDCGSFLDLVPMQVLLTISREMAADTDQKNLSKINQLYAAPTAPSKAEIQALENWNSSIWQSLEQWGKKFPLQQKTYSTLKIVYGDALRVIEDYFLNKGFSIMDARALGLKVLQLSIGESLATYNK